MKTRSFLILLLLLVTYNLGIAKESTVDQSSLDKALALARSDAAQGNKFYDLFLASDLYIPIQGDASTTESRRANAEDHLRIILVGNGNPSYLMMFDSEERLSAWAKRSVRFAVLPGSAIVKMMDSKVHWVLNVGTDRVKEFVPAEIEWLKKRVANVKMEQGNIASGTKVQVRSDVKPSAELLNQLMPVLKRNIEITKAYLVRAQFDYQPEHWILVVESSPMSSEAQSIVYKELALSVQSALSSKEYMDVLDLNSNTGGQIVGGLQPIYQVTEHV